MLLLGHRGDSGALPENTLPALRASLPGGPAGADGIELDVRLDAAGRPRVFHDDDTGRLTGVPGAFETHPVAFLDSLRVSEQPIPHLSDVVSLAADGRRLTINVELKTSPRPAALVSACRPFLDALTALDGVSLIVSSFDPRVLFVARNLGADWPLAYIYEDPAALAALPLLEGSGPVDLHPRHDLATPDHLSEYRRAGRAFRCWTVDEPAEAGRLAALGIAAVITNRPRFLRDALALM